MSILEKNNFPDALKLLSANELDLLASEIREKIIDVVSRNGGHLSSSLGTVEISLALHSIFASPKDRIIWDVGHQAYTHKILTGRLRDFESLRKFHGLSGFPNRFESPHDPFTTGHAGTSVSCALGIARGRDLNKEDFSVIAVIGDGSLSCGMALEAFNNIIGLKSNFILILNDNQMSISKNVGAWSNYFTKIRTNPIYVKMKDRGENIVKRIPKIGTSLFDNAEKLKNRFKHFIINFKAEVVFEELGFKYIGPIDGHNIPMMMSVLHYAKDINGPVLLHMYTEKGHGYKPAEKDPTKFHGIAPFDKFSGEKFITSAKNSYTAVFGRTIARIADENKKIVAITAAMVDGTGLDEFSAKYPSRFFDVGIAEEHAIAFASGLATEGLIPIVAIYSTFIQRSYDQIVHDVCLQNTHVIFCLDRSGFVGEDGPTHHGVFDIAYLRHIPNIVVSSPKDENELQHLVFTAVKHNGPFAIRYPRDNGEGVKLDDVFKELPIGKAEIVHKPKTKNPKNKILIIAIGSMVNPSVEAAKILEDDDIGVTVINAIYVKPLDEELIDCEAKKTDLIVTVEEGCVLGGFGSCVNEFLLNKGLSKPVHNLGIPDQFIEHGERKDLLDMCGLSAQKISKTIKNFC